MVVLCNICEEVVVEKAKMESARLGYKYRSDHEVKQYNHLWDARPLGALCGVCVTSKNA